MSKILVVEDESDLAEMIEFILKQENFEVETAENGRVALEKADSFKPDLILLDIMMPEMNGLEVCRQLKSTDDFKDTLIIMLTAKGQKEDVKNAVSAGANGYIVKPFDYDDLVKRIKDEINGIDA